MKKAIVLAMAMFLIVGVAYAEDAETQRVVEVKNEEGELKNCFLLGDKGVCTLWGGITGYDAKDVWTDVTILISRNVKTVDFFINSGGGDAFSGMSIADTIRMAKADGVTINTYASGLVASAAVPVFLAGDKRTASKNTTFMIHRGKLFKMFSSESLEDLNAQRAMMELSEEQYVNFLVLKTNLTEADIEDKIDRTTWFSAEQAMEWGFVDAIK